MTTTNINWEKASGHQILAAAGKKILRPGGIVATEQLFQWADFPVGATVLELASSFGYTAIALARRYQVQVVGVEKNPASVARARDNVAAAGLTNQVQIIEGDIFHLEEIKQQFDYVLAEAILTMQAIPGKEKILQGISARLKEGGKFLSHEMIAKNREQEIHQALAETIRVNSTPISESRWIGMFLDASLQVQNYKTGDMRLLNPVAMIQDEGLLDTVKIFSNILTKPPIRKRILPMRQVLQKYKKDLGYIVLCAVKTSVTI